MSINIQMQTISDTSTANTVRNTYIHVYQAKYHYNWTLTSNINKVKNIYYPGTITSLLLELRIASANSSYR